MADIELLEGEEWRPVVGLEGEYEVSNMGRIRSLDRVLIDKNGRSMRYRGKLLTPRKLGRPKGNTNTSYRYVYAGKRNNQLVHVLVAEAFIGPRPERHDVMHINGLRDDNRASNLRYGSRSENLRSTHLYGGRTAGQKMDAQTVLEIRKRKQNGESGHQIARELNLSSSAINRAANGSTYKWLKEDGSIVTT